MMEDLVEHEHEYEEIRGIPGRLPKGEYVLWQGAPNWKSIAFRVFHVRLVAIYFAVIVLWRIVSGLHDSMSLIEIVTSVFTVMMMAAIAITLIGVVAWSIGKTTVYSITNKRVLMRIGIALSLTLNLPFSKVASAAVKRFGKNRNTGNLSLDVIGDNRVAWLVLWPHARPWKTAPAQPTFRCIDDVEDVADILATALEQSIEHKGVQLSGNKLVQPTARDASQLTGIVPAE